MEWLIQFDKDLLVFINSFHSPFWDTVMWLISGKLTWAPLYLGILIYMFYANGWKKGLVFIGAVAVLITLVDQSSVIFFKNMFCRYRPTHNLEVGPLLHIVKGYKGGMYGFVSSHAANSFAIAVFTSLVFKNKHYTWAMLVWAAVVSYSRMYLGVHYPADIVGGAMLGTTLAFAVWFAHNKVVHVIDKR